LGTHQYVLEDGPELPKVPGTHAEKGGEVLEGIYTEDCTSIDNEDEEVTYDQARLLRRFRKGRRPGTSPDPAGIVSKDPRVAPT
jgi:hypothetical protein